MRPSRAAGKGSRVRNSARYSISFHLALRPGPPPRHRIERWPGGVAQGGDEGSGGSFAVGELVARIPAPGRGHGENELAAVAEQVPVDARMVLDHRFGRVGEVELDGPAAARLQVDEQRPALCREVRRGLV